MRLTRQSKTRSGRVYSPSAGVFLTPIACPPPFHLIPLLQAALDRELDALPDIPIDGSLANPSQPLDADAHPLSSWAPIPALSPCTPLPVTHRVRKRGVGLRDDDLGDACPRLEPSHMHPAVASSSSTPLRPLTQKQPRTERHKECCATYCSKNTDVAFIGTSQQPWPEVSFKLAGQSAVVPVQLGFRSLAVNSSGYEACIPTQQARKKLGLRELLDQGWTKVEWDGL
jgi:hypothetical protein